MKYTFSFYLLSAITGFTGFIEKDEWYWFVVNCAYDTDDDELDKVCEHFFDLLRQWDGNDVNDLLEIVERLTIIKHHRPEYESNFNKLPEDLNLPLNLISSGYRHIISTGIIVHDPELEIFAVDKNGYILVLTDEHVFNECYGVKVRHVSDFFTIFRPVLC